MASGRSMGGHPSDGGGHPSGVGHLAKNNLDEFQFSVAESVIKEWFAEAIDQTPEVVFSDDFSDNNATIHIQHGSTHYEAYLVTMPAGTGNLIRVDLTESEKFPTACRTLYESVCKVFPFVASTAIDNEHIRKIKNFSCRYDGVANAFYFVAVNTNKMKKDMLEDQIQKLRAEIESHTLYAGAQDINQDDDGEGGGGKVGGGSGGDDGEGGGGDPLKKINDMIDKANALLSELPDPNESQAMVDQQNEELTRAPRMHICIEEVEDLTRIADDMMDRLPCISGTMTDEDRDEVMKSLLR